MNDYPFTAGDFEHIRPYHDDEINPAIRRIIRVPEFRSILSYFFANRDPEQIIAELQQISGAIEFQKTFMYPLVSSIVKNTSGGLTSSGFEQLKPGEAYLFVANHRDIVLDSALLQVLLFDHGHQTSEITFGSNLMTNPLIIDLGKINRMFVVYRGGNQRELLKNSQLLSSYLRHTITEKKTSAWIAQRNGRTKNGDDRTETGLLKMFRMSGPDEFVESFSQLNIVPVSISYEIEPCAAFKVREGVYASNGIPYMKAPKEDLQSIIKGITGQKGRIHLAVCRPVNEYLHEVKGNTFNEKVNQLALMIDKEIHAHFLCRPWHFVAYDLLHDSNEFAGHYSAEDVESFKKNMENEMQIFSEITPAHTRLWLQIYANPVKNRLTAHHP